MALTIKEHEELSAQIAGFKNTVATYKKFSLMRSASFAFEGEYTSVSCSGDVAIFTITKDAILIHYKSLIEMSRDRLRAKGIDVEAEMPTW